MNNEQFRRLIQSDSPSSSNPTTGAPAATKSRQDATPHVLGSRARSSIPMTPRSVLSSTSSATASADFARQLAEYKARGDGSGGGPPPTKRFKSSAAPKGTKLASGYVDRTALRRQAEDGDDDNGAGEDGPGQHMSEEEADKRKRVKALEEMMRLGQIDRDTFLGLCKELGVDPPAADEGPAQRKGLHFEWLRRTRGGKETALMEGKDITEQSQKVQTAESEEDLEAALDTKAAEDVAPIHKDERSKRGTMAPPPPLSSIQGKALSRDEILKRLKANRNAASQASPPAEEDSSADPSQATRFKKVGGPEKKRWIETAEDGRRREVLLTTDKDGKPKRKVRWLDKQPEKEPKKEFEVKAPKMKPPKAALPPEAKANVMGMDVPAEVLARQQALLDQQQAAEEEDDDIFAGVGADYNPLGGADADLDDDDEVSNASGSEDGEHKPEREHDASKSSEESMRPEQLPKPARRDYFATSTTTAQLSKDIETFSAGPLSSDPSILAALKRAAAIRQREEQSRPRTDNSDENYETSATNGDAEGPEDPVTSDRHRQFLEQLRKRDREDAADMDLGFGESRFGDAEDEDDGPVWADGDDDGGGGGGGEKKKGEKAGRKRGPKKRKGDKDNVNDVLGVLEGRRKR